TLPLPPPPLPACPTRRSSDLPGRRHRLLVHVHAQQPRPRIRLRHQDRRSAPPAPHIQHTRPLTQPLHHAVQRRQPLLLQRAPIQDRKSTRLNSSHVKISYAVF